MFTSLFQLKIIAKLRSSDFGLPTQRRTSGQESRETFVEEHSNTNRTPYLFNGKELDEETGLYYFGLRYFDPSTSIWLSVDPVPKEHESPYAWNTNNPLRFADPTGADSVERAKALVQLNKFISSNKTARKKGVQHPLYSQTGKVGKPGEASDCSGTMRGCITAAGVEDPAKKGHIKTPEGGCSGVYTIEQRTDAIPLKNVEPGSLITFKYKNEKGKVRYHIGMVMEVTTNESGQTTLTFGHTSYSFGPTKTTFTVGDGSFYDNITTGFYKWDSPEKTPKLNTKPNKPAKFDGLKTFGELFKAIIILKSRQ